VIEFEAAEWSVDDMGMMPGPSAKVKQVIRIQSFWHTHAMRLSGFSPQ
jgi:hypothetical protein